MNEYGPILIAALAFAGTVAGLFAQRRGQREETNLGTSKWLTSELRNDAAHARALIDRLRNDLEDMRSQFAAAVDEIHELQNSQRMYDVPAGAEPMSSFPLNNLNVRENVDGFHVAMYLDDVKGTTATGSMRVPLSQRPPLDYPPPPSDRG